MRIKKEGKEKLESLCVGSLSLTKLNLDSLFLVKRVSKIELTVYNRRTITKSIFKKLKFKDDIFH